MDEVLRCGDSDLVHREKTTINSALFKRAPVKVLLHTCNAGSYQRGIPQPTIFCTFDQQRKK